MFKNGQKGQALLIVVLVMVVALTVGLSVVSKSITNLRTSTEEANSQKALAAAEAGIEQSIKSNISIATPQTLSNNSTYSTNVTQVLGTSFLLNGGNPVLQDNGTQIWLSNYSASPSNLYTSPWSGNLTIEWGVTSNSCSEAAIEAVIISGNKTSPVTTRYAFDPCQSRTGSNRFQTVSLLKSTISGKDFYYQATINISSGLIGKIIPLYANTPIGLAGSTPLPSQGSTITATGTSGTTSRVVNVFQGYPEIPSEYFPYNLLSP